LSKIIYIINIITSKHIVSAYSDNEENNITC